MYRRALLTVDGSEVAAAAVAHVPNLIGSDGTVVIVEVVDSVGHILAQTTPAGFEFGGAGLNQDAIESLIAEQRESAQRHLDAARQQLRHAGIREVLTRLAEGVPGPTIIDVALEEGVDVVVMATHGRSGLTRTVIGSVADYVLRHLRGVPVLLIHPEIEGRRRVEVQPAIVAARQ